MRGAADSRDIAIGLAVVCGRIGVSAGKVALVPLRVVARSPVVGPVVERTGDRLADAGRAARIQGSAQLETVAADALGSAEVEQAVDRALAGPLPEAVARLIVERHVLQRIGEQLLTSAELEYGQEQEPGAQLAGQPPGAGLERLVAGALESRVVADVADRVIESAELQHLMEEIVSSPAVRAALTRQTTSLAGEMAAGLRRRTERTDDSAERVVHRWLRRKPSAPAAVQLPRPTYGGLGARGIAFAIDMAITLVIFLAGAAVGGLVGQLVGGFKPAWLAGVLASIGWSAVVGAYLVVFWTVTGETPGMRAMHLRVTDGRGLPPRLGRSLLRLVGLVLAIVPVFAGFIPVLVDGRRRALQDYLAGTAVRSADEPSVELQPRIVV